MPAHTKTFLLTFTDVDAAIRRRDAILASVLQPFAIDLLSPAAAARVGYRGFLLAVRAGGSKPVLNRYADNLKDGEQIGGEQELSFWTAIREFTPEFLRRQPEGLVVRVSSNLRQIASLLKLISYPCISRAGSGITYVYLTSGASLSRIRDAVVDQRWSAVVEFAPEQVRVANELWVQFQSPGATEAFAMMKRVKHLFDPDNLLNRLRLYGRL